MPQSWNNGIVERWNSGFSKDIIHFKLYRQDEFSHLPNIAVSSPSRRLYEPEAKTHFSNIPAFHHSNWGEAPNLIIKWAASPTSYLYITVAPFLSYTLLGFLDFGPCISQGYGSVKHRSFLRRIPGVDAKIPQPQKLVPTPGCGLGQTRLKLA